MDISKIIDFLLSPTATTALIMGFFGSLLAGLLIRYLPRLIAIRSTRVRAKLAEKARRLNEQADEIMKDPALINVTYFSLFLYHFDIVLLLILLIAEFAAPEITPDIPRILLLLLRFLTAFTLGVLAYIFFLAFPLLELTQCIHVKLIAKGEDAPDQPESP